MTLEQSIKEHFEQASKNADIARAAEKLVKCKGRYHAELNYKALAELFGVTVPTVESESKWIKCSEKMPEDGTPVLVLFNSEIRIGEICWEHPSHEDTYQSFRYWDCPYNDGQDWEVFDITHWMPLPPPPTE